MGLFSNLFKRETDDEKQSVTQQKDMLLDEKKWEAIPKWIEVTDEDEKRKLAIIASSIANFDSNSTEYQLNAIEKRNPEYRRLAIIIASTINFLYPSREQKIVSIKKIR